MESKVKSETEITNEVEKIHKEVQPALYEYSALSKILFEEKSENFKMEGPKTEKPINGYSSE